MTIRANTADGEVVYTETHTVLSNTFGLVNLVIGQGTPQTGEFSAINWGNANHFLETAIDLNGSGQFQVLGVTQFLSVPYAINTQTLTLTSENGYQYEISVDDYGNLRGTTNSDPNCPSTVIDADGNIYNVLTFGVQCWMAQNLNVGIRINGVQNSENNGIIEKYCYYNNPANCEVYGGLYQWDEMMQYATTEGAKGICPTGWHLPTNDDWTYLTTYVSNQTAYRCNSITTAIAKSLAATTHWNTSTGTCTIGNNLAANNATGFTALPGGYRQYDGSFTNVSASGNWWSSYQIDATYAKARQLNNYDIGVNLFGNYMSSGLSVRCLKDN